MAFRIVVTCEHAGNRVPARFAPLFVGTRARMLLRSHRGWDPGALALARHLARRFKAPLVATTITRLLVDTNRTHRRPSLFSEITAPLDPRTKEQILARYFNPHRDHVIAAVERASRSARVLHLAAHTFAPVVRKERRQADVSLLYDPHRPAERSFCALCKRILMEVAPELRVRRNYPFLGVSEGMTSTLRQLYPDPRYLGIEVEINQRFLRRDPALYTRVREAVTEALGRALVLAEG